MLLTLCMISSISSITISDITHTQACNTRTQSIYRGQHQLRSHGRMGLPLLIGLLDFEEASTLCDGGRSRAVPVRGRQAVPPRHPPGEPCQGLPVPCVWPLASLGPGPTGSHGGSWEVQPSLPRDRVCNLTNRHWKNWAGFSAFGCLFPSGRAAASSGQHELLSGHPVTRELICSKNNHCSAQALFSMRRSCLHQCQEC